MDTCLERLEHYFTENRVYYEVQEHRTAYTIQEVAAALHEKGQHVAKVFIAWADERPLMLVLPAPTRVDLERVKSLLHTPHVRRAREVEFAGIFGDCDVGAMPPFGNLYDVPVYLDRTLADQPYLVFQAGSHRYTMKIAMSDYWRLVKPVIGDFTVQSAPQPEVA
jgi:Ala-tRNA(Pro) deacylase